MNCCTHVRVTVCVGVQWCVSGVCLGVL